MRLFQITSPGFTGYAELVYDDKGVIQIIDFSNAEMNDMQMLQFKDRITIQVNNLASGFKNTRVTIVEKDYEVTFEQFWKKYNKKINKKRTQPLWDRLSKADQVKAYTGITPYDKYLAQEKWRPKADPEKYLRDRYWENEYR
jgi:hypothetical protein